MSMTIMMEVTMMKTLLGYDDDGNDGDDANHDYE